MKPFFLFLILTFGCSALSYGQQSTHTQTNREYTVDIQTVDSILIADILQQESPSIIEIARRFVGRPYVAHTLEVNDEEQLVVNTRQFDCTTFVETVTALVLCVKDGKKRVSDYTDMLCRLRYRQGVLHGYESRLHYFTDWIVDKQQMGLVTELQAPNPPFTALQTVRVNYMSRHPQNYKALKNNPSLVPQIRQQEEQLTGLQFRYIPKAVVKNYALLRKTIQDGDIIAITCSKPGLDIAHLGFAVWRNGRLHLLNASQLHHQVIEEPMPLHQYLSKHPSHTGIRIIRMN